MRGVFHYLFLHDLPDTADHSIHIHLVRGQEHVIEGGIPRVILLQQGMDPGGGVFVVFPDKPRCIMFAQAAILKGPVYPEGDTRNKSDSKHMTQVLGDQMRDKSNDHQVFIREFLRQAQLEIGD